MKINLLDTPGYGNFVADARAALRAVDAAAVLVCGVAGVEVQTEKTWKWAEEYQLPRMLIVNKLDRERSDFGRVMEADSESIRPRARWRWRSRSGPKKIFPASSI